jgi:AbiV family abortive infection protein
MLKDNKNRWVEELEISEDLWIKTMQETLNGIFALIDSVEKLLQNGGHVTVCSGLYMYALEEYGKLLLLKNCKSIGGVAKIKYKNEFRSHLAKFGIAIRTLPQECTTLHEGAFDRTCYDSEAFDTNEIADCETRQGIFYTDFTMDGKHVKRIPTVNGELFKNAVTQLKTIILGMSIP